MTDADAAAIARDNASHCEVKKHALRQTQDGIVVAFVVHPNDVPPALQLAPLGTRYMLALVEIGEDEQPKAAAHERKVTKEPAPDDAPARAPTPISPEKRLVRRAVMLCSDPVFQAFLKEHDMAVDQSEKSAKTAIYLICHVDSRSKIIPGTPAGDEWEKLYSKFMAWRLAA